MKWDERTKDDESMNGAFEFLADKKQWNMLNKYWYCLGWAWLVDIGCMDFSGAFKGWNNNFLSISTTILKLPGTCIIGCSSASNAAMSAAIAAVEGNRQCIQAAQPAEACPRKTSHGTGWIGCVSIRILSWRAMKRMFSLLTFGWLKKSIKLESEDDRWFITEFWSITLQLVTAFGYGMSAARVASYSSSGCNL